MGVLTLMLALTSPIVVLHLLLYSQTIMSTTAQSTSGAVANRSSTIVLELLNQIRQSGQGQAAVTGLAKRVLCEGRQTSDSQCSNVPPLVSAGVPGAPGRKKRHWYYFRSGYLPIRYYPRPPLYPGLPPPSPPVLPGHILAICPNHIDQSAIYQLNAAATTYPIEDVAQAIGTSAPNLVTCLSEQTVVPSDPPTLATDPFRATAISTCPQTQQTLTSYNSLTFGGTCIPLLNYQETIRFVNCTARFCSCNETTPVSAPRGSSLRRNLCYPDYTTVSLWAYCPSRAPGMQIVRDRIIVPTACRCQSVLCSVQ